MLRICFLGRFTGRGAEKATVTLANSLSERCAVHILNTAPRELVYPKNDNVVYETYSAKSVLSYIRHLRRYIKRNRIDILIAVEALTGITALPATLFRRTKCVVWDHGNFFQNKTSKNMHLARKLELLLCDAFVVLTRRDMALYRKNYKMIRTKLVNIYNSNSVTTDAAYNPGAKRIVSVGHIDKNKNFIIIPRMAAALFRDRPDWSWDIYGNGNPADFEELKGEIAACGMEEHVFLRDFEKDIGKIYTDAALCVMTSIHEGFPLTLIEAKSYGVPIVSFNIDTGPDEIVRDGVNGYLVDGYDQSVMAARIAQLIDSETLRRAFSEKADLDLDALSPEAILRQWAELFNSLNIREEL